MVREEEKSESKQEEDEGFGMVESWGPNASTFRDGLSQWLFPLVTTLCTHMQLQTI